MISSTYLRLELLRTLRNRRFAVLSLGFPLVLFLVFAGPQRHTHDFGGSGIDAPLYYMVGLAAFGTMSAVLSSGARIAAERSIGWNRQLRLTPLRVSAYFAAKVVTAYVLALITLLVLCIAGTALGVRLSAGRWVEMTALILVGLIPFAPIGIFVGHRISVDSIGPAMGGMTALFALLGGTWYPLQDGTLRDIGRDLPSYWLVQASHVSLGGSAWSRHGWLVVGAWTLGAAVLAGRAYRADTERA